MFAKTFASNPPAGAYLRQFRMIGYQPAVDSTLFISFRPFGKGLPKNRAELLARLDQR